MRLYQKIVITQFRVFAIFCGSSVWCVFIYIKSRYKNKQTLILVTATSTIFFLSRFRRLRPPSSSTSTDPRKCSRKTVPVAPTPNGKELGLNGLGPIELLFKHCNFVLYHIDLQNSNA